MPLTELMGQAILENLATEEIEFAESRHPELSPDQIEPIFSADTPATLADLVRERCQFAAAWHHARQRLELSAKYKRLAEHFAAARLLSRSGNGAVTTFRRRDLKELN